MSGGYADRLKAYPNKGVCGLPEKYDNERERVHELRTQLAADKEERQQLEEEYADRATARIEGAAPPGLVPPPRPLTPRLPRQGSRSSSPL